jgi:phage gpG-like protein
MNAQQQINNWFNSFEHKFEVAVPNIIAETATEYYQEAFNKQAWDNVPWQPLNEKYAKKKTRGRGRILTASGILQRSIRPTEVNANRVVITAGNSKTPYARVHNEGLRVSGTRNVRNYTNKNFMGKGKPVRIKAHSRTVNYQMPKRQFMGHSVYLNDALKDRLIKAFNKK